MSRPRLMRAAGIATLIILSAAAAKAQTASSPLKGVPLAQCLLYNSYRLTPQGMMQCSYQCGDRIIMRSGYQTCPGSWARPPEGQQ